MSGKIIISVFALITFAVSSISCIGETSSRTYMKIKNVKYYLEDGYCIEDDEERYYKLDFVMDKLGYEFEVSDETAVLKVRNVTIELMENSESVVIKTPPYGTRLEVDGTLSNSALSDGEIELRPDKREKYSQYYPYDENQLEFRNVLLKDVNIIELEKDTLLKSSDSFYISLEFIDEIFEIKEKGDVIQIIDYYVDYLVVPDYRSDGRYVSEIELPRNDKIEMVYRGDSCYVNKEDFDLNKEYRNKIYENNSIEWAALHEGVTLNQWFPDNIYIIGYTKNGYIVTQGIHDSYIIDNMDIRNIKYYQYNNRYIGPRVDV